MKPAANSICEAVVLKLVEGGGAGEDAEVREHVRSCLHCFRTAADLRALPGLAELMQEPPPDPGSAFWASFPQTVADAWQARRTGAVAQPAPTLLSALRRWFAPPLRSALAGAAAAALLVFVLVRTRVGPVERHEPVPEIARREVLPPLPAVLLHASGISGSDVIEALDLDDLRLVVADVIPPAAVTDEDPVAETSVADSIEGLDGRQLRRVASALRRRGSI